MILCENQDRRLSVDRISGLSDRRIAGVTIGRNGARSDHSSVGRSVSRGSIGACPGPRTRNTRTSSSVIVNTMR